MNTNPRRLLFTGAMLLFLSSSLANAQDWPRYIRSKDRGNLIKHSAKVSGMGALMSTSALAIVFWVTEPVARAMVSEMVDRERLTTEEAEARYKELRPEGAYYFMLQVKTDSGPTFKETLIGPSRPASKVLDPLAKGESFLQRADDRKIFSKGEIADQQFEFIWRSQKFDNNYRLTFPRSSRQGDPLIKALEDKIEIQFTMSNKKVILDYKVKDLVARLEDL